MASILPNIKLSEEEFISMKNSSILSGSEGVVIRDGDYAIKIFKVDFGHANITEEKKEFIRENKFFKLCMIYQLKDQLDQLFFPLETYSFDGSFVGYKGVWFPYPSLEFATLEITEKIFYLKKIKQMLEQIHALGIVYGDIKDDNILLDVANKDIILIDIDNIQIGERPIDLMSSFAKNFVKQYENVDEKLDCYMMNLLTLDQIHHYFGWYGEIIENLKLGFVPEEFNISRNKKLIHEMGHINRNFHEEYFIDQCK